MQILIPERTDAPATSMYANYLRSTCESSSKTRRTFIGVPGGPGGNHTVFNSIKDELLKYGDLILFDPRGCGSSEPSEARYCSIEHYIEDINAVRNYFRINKVILFGGSYGSMASLGYAIKYGTYLEKLILVAGAASYKFLKTAAENLELRGTPDQIAIGKHLFDGSFKDAEHFKNFYKVTSSLYLSEKNVTQTKTPPTIAPNIPYNIDVTNYGFKVFLRNFDFEKDLHKIKCKTLILVGDNDWINDPIYSKFMAKHIPNSTLKILNNCGHFVWIDQREEFKIALSSFL